MEENDIELVMQQANVSRSKVSWNVVKILQSISSEHSFFAIGVFFCSKHVFLNNTMYLILDLLVKFYLCSIPCRL